MACSSGTFAYTIKAGDTFFHLAQRFGTTVAAIEAANPGVNPNNLQVGQVVCIPGGGSGHTCPSGTFSYTVQAGDTFFRLAQRFSTTVAAIQNANPGVNPNNLQIGSTLCIPGAPVPGVCPPGTFPYTVVAGDTCFSLAQRFGTTVSVIQAVNPGINCNNLQIGQRICIPNPCPTGSFQYVIQAGDTCFSLAQRFNTTVTAIQNANPGLNCNNLQIGQVICIPGQPVTCPTGTFAYTIVAGDTCFGLAQRFGTTVAAIQAANPGLDCNNLQIGQVICIPSVPHVCPTGTFAYIIRPGDTCFGLAARFGTSVAAIQAANPGINCNNLQIGSTICIPVRTCGTGTFAYTVVAGDTCFSIAQRFNTSVQAILNANPGLDCNNLQIGEVICIPLVPGVCPTGTFPYIIRAGDTCFNLAVRFGTTVAAIQAANPCINCNNLQIGSTICIPQRTCLPGTTAYTVAPGDTCFSIAQRFNTSVQAILNANPGLDCNNLQIGEVICIPLVPGVCPTGTFPYTIRAGDTCFNLAVRFGTTVAAIQAANPGLNCNNLQIGSTICIPQRTCLLGTTPYTVVPGDTCISIAQRFNTTVQAILNANPGLDCNNLQVGEVICIPLVPGVCPTGTFPYTIRAGDTCFGLAQRFGTTVTAIEAANPGLNCNNLQIGSTICIPQRACGTGTFAYTVVAGDTCASIAARFGTTVQAILNANPGLDCNNLQIGEVICVPGTQIICPEGAFVYTIRAGDTCFTIAQRFRTTVDAILAINPGLNCNNLQIGQRICVPCGATS